MDELLKKLLASELLTEDTRVELKESFTKLIQETVEAAKKETEDKVRVELTEQFIADKENLIEALDTKAEEFFRKEMNELREDIENFKDLEVQYADKLNVEKKKLQEQMKAEMKELLENLDQFLDAVITEEFEELRESIEEVKKNQLGMKIFEAFQDTFRRVHIDESKIQETLNAKELELKNTSLELKKLKEEHATLSHAKKLAEVLEPLTGRSRELMEALLKHKPIEKLEEGYKTYITRILTETVATKPVDTTEKEDNKVLAEGDKGSATEEKTVVKTGDLPSQVNENATQPVITVDRAKYAELQKLAGIVN